MSSELIPTIDVSRLGAKIAKAIGPYMSAQAPVLSRSVLQPPSGSVGGDRYIVPSAAVEDWAGRLNQIAYLDGGWRFTIPGVGWTTWVADEGKLYVFTGMLWAPAGIETGGGGGGGSGGTETLSNKRMPARTTTADGQLACAIAILNTPVPGSYIGVRVNGVDVPDVGDGTNVNVACYFSNDGGQSGRAWGDIAAGDTLWWNGSVAGFELAPSDIIEFIYES